MLNDANRVKEIFLEAAEQPDEAARAAYLDRACGDDAGLRERVERSSVPTTRPAVSSAARAVKPPDLNGATQELGVDQSATPATAGRPRTPTTCHSCPRPPGPIRSAGWGITKCSRCSARAASASCSAPSTRRCSAWSRSR